MWVSVMVRLWLVLNLVLGLRIGIGLVLTWLVIGVFLFLIFLGSVLFLTLNFTLMIT